MTREERLERLRARVRDLGDIAADLGRLKRTKGWRTLTALMEAKADQLEMEVGRALMDGGLEAPPVDQRLIDFQRGYLSGIRFLVRNVEQAEAEFERALNRAARMAAAIADEQAASAAEEVQ